MRRCQAAAFGHDNAKIISKQIPNMNAEMRGGGDVLHSEQQSLHSGSKVSFGILSAL